MSRSKNNGRKFRLGKLCPICRKGKMEKSDCKCSDCYVRDNNYICKTCHWSNF